MKDARSARVAGLLAATVAVTALVTVFGIAPVAAHDPIFVVEDQTTPDDGPYLPDGTISWALYGSVLGPGETRGFEFDLRDGEELYISLLIPNLEPEISLAEDELPVIELEAPDGTTRTIVNDMRETFDEPFSNTSYLTLSEVREPAQEGRYRGLVVGSAPSRFTVAIGEREEFFTPAERTGDRPSTFPGIAAPLQAWYSTPPGEDAPVGLAEGEGEIEMEMIEEAIEEGIGSAPDEALEENATQGSAPEESSPEEALGDGTTDPDGSLGWVAPAAAALAVALGGAWILTRRRAAASEPNNADA